MDQLSLKGVDVEALRRLVNDMLGCRGDLEVVLRRLTQELESLPWIGPDRERFVSDWSTHSGHLQMVIHALREGAEIALRHVQQQEAISGGGHT